MNKYLNALNKLYGIPVNDENEIYLEEQYGIIEKALKTLEIIRNKEVDIKAFNDLETLEDYNYYVSPELTQEEYELVSGVLKSE